MDQKMLFVLLKLTLIIPGYYYFTDISEAFQGQTLSNESEWKNFKDRENLFTVQYPSDWIPNYAGESDKSGPIDIFFDSPGYNLADNKGVTIEFIQYESKSAFNSAQESLESEINEHENDKSLTKFEVERPIECSTYSLNGLQACSYIYEISDKERKSAVIAVDALSNDGTEYESYYLSDFDSFKQFLPTFEKMVKSFKTTENDFITPDILPSNETITDLNTTNTTSSSDDDFSLN
jgi:hypothetical protein